MIINKGFKTKTSLNTQVPREVDLGTVKVGHGGDISIRFKGKVTKPDGTVTQVIDHREGHSFVRGFIEALYTQMGCRTNATDQYVDGRGTFVNSNYDWGEKIASFTQASPCVITMVSATSNNLDERWVQISEATHSGGTPSVLNGQEVFLNYVTTNQYQCFLDAAMLIPVDTSLEGADDANSGSVWHWRTLSGMHFAGVGTFEEPVLRLGISTDPVSIMDWDLHQYSYDMNQGKGGMTVNAATPQVTRSYIPMVRQFTNNSLVTVTVEEIGVTCFNSVGNDDGSVLLTRDLQQIIIPTTETLTLEYELETNLDVNNASATYGGITEYFLKILERNMRQTSVSVKNLDNGDVNLAQQYTNLGAISPAGDQRMRPYGGSSVNSSINAWRGGIIVGRDDGVTGTPLVIAQNNAALGDMIVHGRGPGELFHFGSTVEDLLIRGGSRGSITLDTGVSGSVAGILVNSVTQIMSGAEAFDTDLTTTAQNVVDNINAHTSAPNYTATRIGRTIYIDAASDTGSAADGFAIAASPAWTGITSTAVPMANGDTAEFKLRRLFKNESGEDIEIKEVGIAVSVQDSTFGNHSLIGRWIRDGANGRPASTVVADGEVVEGVITIRADV
jgi:hypothetical protein